MKLRQRVAELEKSEIQRKRVEGVLRNSEEKYRTIFETTGTATVIIEEDTIISLANREFEKLSGYSKEEVEGKKSWTEFVVKDDLERMKEYHRLRRVNPDLAPRNYECRFIDREGNIKNTLLTIDVIPGTKKSVASLLDITEHKKGEEKLQASEEKYRTVVENANEAIIVIQDGVIKFANPKTMELCGYSEKELTSKPFAEFIHPEDQDMVKERYLRRLKGEKLPPIYSFRFINKEGNTRWVEISAVRITWQGKPATLNFLTDITERKKAEEKIKKLYSLQIVIRKINQAFLKVKNESELFQKICDSLLEIEDFKFAWIGLVQKGTFEVKPVAHAGFEKGYLSSIKVRWDDSEYGRGPTGIAIKTGKPSIVQDIENDPRYALWRKEAKKRGYASCMALPLIHQGERIGTLNVYSGRKDAFQDDEVEHLKEVASDIAIGIRSLRQEKELEKSLEELEKTTEGIIYTVAKIVKTKDPYTAGHQKRVANLASAIAEEMGLPKEQIRGIYMTGTIHDIGKIYVPTEILTKPGRLAKIEFEMIKTHPEHGYNMLKDVEFPWPVALTILQHHERMDGSGYPQGLKGEDILLEARILGVADVVEAMSSHRPYRPALGIERALEEISHNKGKLYDPQMVDACLRLFREKKFKFE